VFVDRAGGVKVSKKIGEGVYGEVYSATHSGQSVALKVFTSCCRRSLVYQCCGDVSLTNHSHVLLVALKVLSSCCTRSLVYQCCRDHSHALLVALKVLSSCCRRSLE